MLYRPRRNRKSAAIRAMVEETQVHTRNLIYPLFVIDGKNLQVEVASMPGQYRRSPDLLLKEIEECLKLGITTFDLFPAFPDEKKDKEASLSYNPENFYLQAISRVKKELPEACLMSDVALDPYNSDGHDGLVRGGKILNDETLEVLAKMAVAQAEAGIDIIGPSDMMDGRVEYLRNALDARGFTDVSIMSYTAKYASAFYNPFRDALDSAPREGEGIPTNKKTYQMNPANSREALLEADLDAAEGADFLMVKPALAYLDIIKLLKDNYNLPIAAYNVSGEYAMVKAAAERGWLNGEAIMLETLLSIKRAGADIILTYFAKEFAKLQANR
ncbi:porphobilinogen synthase [Cesiribacter sp. SM1]|uniref:porphobilinogen synthase n=1 Tax=Cesiribacter sp. SM1 TaxID=2861196 RepID=UPI001CD60B7C|nr:porphobilinogen synthase [Cesiribacter sp. SM1]